MKNKLFTIFILAFLTTTAFSQTLKVGDKAPEIVQKSITGEEFKLSSLQGQMVLIDFWASWCGPCRRETPNLIEAYNKYKDEDFKNSKGFTIVSISLDEKKDFWIKAIENDGMIWPFHLCDLKGWKSQDALLYNIKSVPASYLIDGDGIIIAINLRGDNLDKTLKKHKKGWF